jgi:cell wall-associated NlpC family hydrolase
MAKRNYSSFQFGFELLLSWAILYFVFPLAYFKIDYMIRANDPEALLHHVSEMGVDEFTSLAERALRAGTGKDVDELTATAEQALRMGAREVKGLIAEIERLSRNKLEDRSTARKTRPAARKAYAPVSTASVNPERAELVETAQSYIGTPYQWGGETPSGFDCSGYVQYVYRNAAGVDLPRTSRTQYSSTRGSFVKRSDLQPGDLVFFVTRGLTVSHVGMYVGESKFIHAPSSGNLVRIDSLNDPYFWKDRFVGGKDFI